MISLQKLSKHYGGFLAVDGLDLEVRPGQVYGFLGPNGAGKTSTIKMLCGLLKPSQGRILIEGMDMATQPREAKAVLGYVPDRPELFPYLSAAETLALVGGLHAMAPAKARQRGGELLEAFGLQAWADEAVGTFSHGMRQKLAVCTALLPSPRVLVLDEPMVGLDPQGSRQMRQLLRGLADRGLTVFLSIHTLEIAEKLCDRFGVLLNGRLRAEGTAEEIKSLAGSASSDLEASFLRITGGEEVLDLDRILGSQGA